MTALRPVFIGACPRSGTTFLGERLGALLNGRVTPESQFKREILAAFAEGRSQDVPGILDDSFYYRLWTERPARADLEAAIVDGPEAVFARLVFPDGIDRHPNGIWIDHTPVNFSLFNTLITVFPQAQFVHLVRDGRAVFASVRKLDWGPKNPVDAAWWWQAQVSAGLAASQMHPERCLTVTYERLLCGDPDDWSQLTRFVTGDAELALSEADITKQGSYNVPDFTRHQHARVGTGLARERAEAWKQDLTSREIEIFEANAGSLLDPLGYERCYPFARHATRREKIVFGEWPVRVRTAPLSRIRVTLRRLSVRRP